MRGVLILLFLLVSARPTEGRQSSAQDFRIVRWEGGSIAADARVGLNLAGPVSASGTYGGIYSGMLAPGAGSVFANPADLGRLDSPRFEIGLRWAAGNGTLGLGPRSLVEQASLDRNTDSILEDYAFAGVPEYTRVSGITAGQPSQLSSVVAAWPVAPGWSLAAGYHRLLESSADFSLTGMEVQLDASRTSGAQTIAIDLLAQVALAGSAALSLDAYSVGTGVRLSGEYEAPVHFGASIVRHEGGASMDLQVNPEAMLVLSGSQQYFFNDPGDRNLDASRGESNRLYWRSSGHYRGSGWSGRAGLSWRTVGGAFGGAIVGVWNGPVSMHDPSAYSDSWLPRFVNLSGETDPGPDDEALLDVDRMSLARPNLTRPTRDSLGTDLTFRVPSSLTAGVDLGLGRQSITLNYTLYSGELSAAGSFGDKAAGGRPFRIGKRLSHGVRFGLDLRFPDRWSRASWLLLPVRLLFLDVDGLLFQAMGRPVGYRDPHYRVAVGMVDGEAISLVERNIRDSVEEALSGPMPVLLSLGRSYSLGERIDVGVTVIGLPDLGLRTGIAWRIP